MGQPYHQTFFYKENFVCFIKQIRPSTVIDYSLNRHRQIVSSSGFIRKTLQQCHVLEGMDKQHMWSFNLKDL